MLSNLDPSGVVATPLVGSRDRTIGTSDMTSTMAALHRHHLELLRLHAVSEDLAERERESGHRQQVVPQLRESEKQIVRQSWASILPRAEFAAELFFRHLFEIAPSLKPLFKIDMREQGRRLMDMFDACVNSLDRLDQILPAIQALGRRHGNYGVRAEHYGIARETWFWMLEQVLGDQFTRETFLAWSKVYQFLTDVMQSAAANSPLTTSD